jgi:hypothetical protein
MLLKVSFLDGLEIDLGGFGLIHEFFVRVN